MNSDTTKCAHKYTQLLQKRRKNAFRNYKKYAELNTVTTKSTRKYGQLPQKMRIVIIEEI